MPECESGAAPITREKGAADVTAWCPHHHDHIYDDDHICDDDHIYDDDHICDHGHIWVIFPVLGKMTHL